MSPYHHLPDYAAFVGADIFWKAVAGPRDNGPEYLLPGQTEWFGPIPRDCGDGYPDSFWQKYHLSSLKEFALDAIGDGIYLHVQLVGEYIRTHRLRNGPARKLSDWKQLPAGVSMLLHPAPTCDDVELALNRVRYMRLKGFGNYRSRTDDGGALWLERL